MKNRKVTLIRRPTGDPVETDFSIVDEDVAPLEAGQVLVKVDTLSIDAFIRTTFNEVSFHQGSKSETLFRRSELVLYSKVAMTHSAWVITFLERCVLKASLACQGLPCVDLMSVLCHQIVTSVFWVSPPE